MTMRRWGQAAIALLLTGLAGQAMAQSIILFEDSNYRGREVRVSSDVRNLQSLRFNDRTSSFRIVSGQWELCQHDDYGGTCEIHSSDQPSMGRMNDQLTSLRPVAAGRPGGRRSPSLTFYSGPNYTGRSVVLTTGTPDFTRIGFNDQARSVRHSGRGAWVACQHVNFDGACMVIDGDIANIGGGMAGAISSAEPDYAGRPSRPGRPGGGNAPQSGVFLFDGVNFSGQRVDVSSDISNLSRMGFNDRADSLVVARGETWIICDDEGFTDNCQRVEGSISDLSRLGLRNRLTSLRRVDGTWGGPGGGYPGPGGHMDIRGGTRGVDSLFFPRPEINGYAVDRCLGGYGARCDQQAADRMCEAAGMRQAAYFNVDRYNRTRTWYLGQNRACTSGQCAALVDVLCTD